MIAVDGRPGQLLFRILILGRPGQRTRHTRPSFSQAIILAINIDVHPKANVSTLESVFRPSHTYRRRQVIESMNIEKKMVLLFYVERIPATWRCFAMAGGYHSMTQYNGFDSKRGI